MVFFFFKQKTAYERRISDWSSDVCSSDLLATDQLTWLELFSQDIVEPAGKLEGHLTLAGTRAEPALGGQAQLTDFSTELPALGIALENGHVRLDALADGTARITGSVRSASPDRKRVVEGKSVAGRVDLGGRRILKKTKHKKNQ